MRIEDAGRREIVTAPAAHRACSPDPELLLGGPPSELLVGRIVARTPASSGGTARALSVRGLGLEIYESVLGASLLTLEA